MLDFPPDPDITDLQDFSKRYGHNEAEFRLKWHGMFRVWPSQARIDDYNQIQLRLIVDEKGEDEADA